MTGVGRVGFDKMKTKGRDQAPFDIRYQNGKGPKALQADAVIDATGTWFVAQSGRRRRPARHRRGASVRGSIAYGMPDVLGRDRARYAGKTVAVLGAGHSAIGTLIDLARLEDEAPATEIVWLLRGDAPEKAFGGGANDKLAARGELGAAFAALVAGGKIRVEAGFRVSHLGGDGRPAHRAPARRCCSRPSSSMSWWSPTGFRPQLDFLREIRLALDPALEVPPRSRR